MNTQSEHREREKAREQGVESCRKYRQKREQRKQDFFRGVSPIWRAALDTTQAGNLKRKANGG